MHYITSKLRNNRKMEGNFVIKRQNKRTYVFRCDALSEQRGLFGSESSLLSKRKHDRGSLHLQNRIQTGRRKHHQMSQHSSVFFQYIINIWDKKTEAETLFKKIINNTAQKDRRLKRRNVFCILGNGLSCKIYQILQYKSFLNKILLNVLLPKNINKRMMAFNKSKLLR